MMTKILSNSSQSIIFDDCDASFIAGLRISVIGRCVYGSPVNQRDHGNKHTLGRLLLHLEDQKFKCDHKNRDIFDFRRGNLRIVSISENNCNQDIRHDNTSGFKGVTFHKQHNKFQATIAKNRKKHYLGLFETAEEAARAYDRKAKILHGEFAVLNFVEKVDF